MAEEELWEETAIRVKILEERFKKLTEVIYNYLEAGSSIALSSVKAALKNI